MNYNVKISIAYFSMAVSYVFLKILLDVRAFQINRAYKYIYISLYVIDGELEMGGPTMFDFVDFVLTSIDK